MPEYDDITQKILSELRVHRGELQEGGPAVDLFALNLYAAGEIQDDKEAAEIGRNIVTWKEWHDAYWDAVHGQWAAEKAVTEAEGAPVAEDSLPGAERSSEQKVDSPQEGQGLIPPVPRPPELRTGDSQDSVNRPPTADGTESAGSKGERKRRFIGITLAVAATALVAVGVTIWKRNDGLGLTAELRDFGSLVGIDEHERLVGLRGISASLQDGVKMALSDQRFRLPESFSQLRSVRGGPDSGAESPYQVLMSPVSTAVMTDRPTFRWKESSEKADSYTVFVYDTKVLNPSEPLIQSEELDGTDWTVLEPLTRGKVYSWKVKVQLKDGGERFAPRPGIPEPRFKVLDADKTAEVETQIEELPDSHLVRCVVYAEAGLLDKAEREIRQLAADNPDSAVPNKMLQMLVKLRYSGE